MTHPLDDPNPNAAYEWAMGQHKIRDALEAEWYNGNLTESAYDRLLKVLGDEKQGGEQTVQWDGRIVEGDGHGHAAADCPDR